MSGPGRGSRQAAAPQGPRRAERERSWLHRVSAGPGRACARVGGAVTSTCGTRSPVPRNGQSGEQQGGQQGASHSGQGVRAQVGERSTKLVPVPNSAYTTGLLGLLGADGWSRCRGLGLVPQRSPVARPRTGLRGRVAARPGGRSCRDGAAESGSCASAVRDRPRPDERTGGGVPPLPGGLPGDCGLRRRPPRAVARAATARAVPRLPPSRRP